MELIKTGIDGLDEVLYGGIIPDNALLVEGTPGAGKTTLGLQYIYKGALLYGQPGIIITFEEEPQKLYRDALVFGWNLQELESKNLLRVIPSSPEAVRDMLLKPESGFTRLFKSIGASRIMVDSVTHFRRITENVQQLRVLLSKFLTGLMRLTTTAVLIKEIEGSESEGANIEEYIADTVLRLSYEQRQKHRRERFLEVIKSRGQKHISGKHTLKFADTGLEVYPVCAVTQAVEPVRERPEGFSAQSTGIKGLDEMCRGGLPDGSATVVAGSSGTGKTVFATQFLHEGLKRRQSAFLLTFQQSRSALLNASRSFGVNLENYLRDGMLTHLYYNSIDLSVDELFQELRILIEKEKPPRVAVDGLTQLIEAIEDQSYLVDYLGTLLRLFSAHGVTSVFTFEVDKMFGSFEINSRRTLGLFDNLVLLRYVELDGEIRRAIALLKMRETDHDKAIQEYVITRSGIEVKTKFKERVDVMGGTGTAPVETVELKDILADATRWVEATRKMRQRQNQSLK
ncbi:MAG TPA: ATPase domain-containing protein [archaeon]|nr:ATPase domain-containing protein [archaeon]